METIKEPRRESSNIRENKQRDQLTSWRDKASSFFPSRIKSTLKCTVDCITDENLSHIKSFGLYSRAHCKAVIHIPLQSTAVGEYFKELTQRSVLSTQIRGDRCTIVGDIECVRTLSAGCYLNSYIAITHQWAQFWCHLLHRDVQTR